MTIDIRPATYEDIPAITRIYAHSVDHGTATYELEAPDEAEMRRRFDALTGEGYPFIVACEGNIVLGYAYGGPFRARPAYRFMVEDSIYLAPDAQGKGLGKKLMHALIAECRNRGYRQLLAVIGDGSEKSPSVRLHTSCGFTHCGVLVGSGYKHNRWLDTTFMQLELNGGNQTPPDPESVPERHFRKSDLAKA
ncbi:GNAT family N-acetyltransferase [Nitratireductor basaltis]|uniref:N-acetyltransferase GCN5 n=1 Tax=Nitratireductor basaltis TaxID=472175 RepID=A0A084U6Q9_9HYPH|nr:GNAT family N-acetyltransferase [Nitratireductor basaltis]KFB08645.1 N-acetyltransferase GCN5 [Nitratireductor basaltis]